MSQIETNVQYYLYARIARIRPHERGRRGPHRHGLTAPGGLLAGTHPGYNFYRASDGWIALAALEPHFAARVQTASQTAFTVESLNRFFSQQSTQYWQRWASEHDIPLAVVPSPDSSSTRKT